MTLVVGEGSMRRVVSGGASGRKKVVVAVTGAPGLLVPPVLSALRSSLLPLPAKHAFVVFTN
jgi:hypothetical protein